MLQVSGFIFCATAYIFQTKIAIEIGRNRQNTLNTKKGTLNGDLIAKYAQILYFYCCAYLSNRNVAEIWPSKFVLKMFKSRKNK